MSWNHLIVGKVKGHPDVFLARRGNANEPWWSIDPNFALFFPEEKDALGELDLMRRAMDIHHGVDQKTGEPILDSQTKKPIKRIDLPFHIFQLMKLDVTPGPSYKVEGEASIFVCKWGYEPTEYYLDVKGKHPFQELKEK